MDTASYMIEMPPGHLDPDCWFAVSGGGLPHRVHVKIRVKPPGRPVVFALLVDEGAELTSRQLRNMRLPDIAQAVLTEMERRRDDLDPTEDELAAIPPGVSLFDAKGDPTELWELALRGAAADKLSSWLDAVADADVSILESKRGRGASAPSRAALEAFAKTYLEQAGGDPRGAATRTSQRLGWSKATVYRWADLCRAQDLLPPKEK